ncbi:MAG: FG-GAP repeat domain-containing protein [Draconibacterium sp.]
MSLDKWEYICIDSLRPGNDIVKSYGWFGMDMADANADGFPDLVVGKNFYLNPGGKPGKTWKNTVVKDSTDLYFIMNVDNDEFTDIIGLRCGAQYWFEANDKSCTSWTETKIGNEPICSHKTSSMGYCKADIFKGGKPEILFTDRPGKIWCFEIPEKPDSMWDVYVISENGGTDKFVAAGDVDGDGDLDLATAYQYENEKLHRGICWFENPGVKRGNWERHPIGTVDHYADHFAIADFDSDGIPEILATEGAYPEPYPNGIYMFKANSREQIYKLWEKEVIKLQYGTNSIEVADMDMDGDLDFVSGEHAGTCKLQIWENNGRANFTEHVIDSLKESHNGAKLADLDGDGDLDIGTLGWYDHEHVHLWINQAIPDN